MRCTAKNCEHRTPRYDPDEFFNRKKPTNADRIRGMGDEELAEWLATAIAKHYDSEAVVPSVDSVLWIDWLRQEATND